MFLHQDKCYYWTAVSCPFYQETIGWEGVDSGTASQRLYAFGTADAPTPLNPGESAQLSGVLQVVAAAGADFVELTDSFASVFLRALLL